METGLSRDRRWFCAKVWPGDVAPITRGGHRRGTPTLVRPLCPGHPFRFATQSVREGHTLVEKLREALGTAYLDLWYSLSRGRFVKVGVATEAGSQPSALPNTVKSITPSGWVRGQSVMVRRTKRALTGAKSS